MSVIYNWIPMNATAANLYAEFFCELDVNISVSDNHDPNVAATIQRYPPRKSGEFII